MNKYEKLGVIGEGTFGVVLKCRHKETDELVAIKKFKEQDEEDEVTKKITLREVKLLRALKHENIVELKEAFRRKGVLYLVFEHMDKSVMDLLEAKPNGVGTDTVQTLTYQLLRALEHCHRHNVIHRDIKPENLLVNTSDNSLRLCDFGCARQMKANVPLTDYVATRWYRPPELLLSTTDYGKGVDIWGLGCIMGELTDGQPLFAGKSDIDQMCCIQKILGPLTSQQMERCLELSDFKGIQFPDVTQPVSLQKRYASRMPEHHMNLLTSILVMDPSQRLTAKAAIRLPCFKDLRTKDLEQPQAQPIASSGGAEHHKPKNAAPPVSGTPDLDLQPKGAQPKNAAPIIPRTPDLDLPPKAVKLQKKAADALDWARNAETTPAAQAPSRDAGALPSLGAGAPAAIAQAQASLQNQVTAESQKHKPSRDKKDFRMSQDGFGAKRDLRIPLEKAPLSCEDSFEDFLSAPCEELSAAPSHQHTPQAVDMYRLPWESSVNPEDPGMAEYGRTPTPIFGEKIAGSTSQKGFLVDPRHTGGPAAFRTTGGQSAFRTTGGAAFPAAKNAKAPVAPVAKSHDPFSAAPQSVASVAKWKNIGGRGGRWSGA